MPATSPLQPHAGQWRSRRSRNRWDEIDSAGPARGSADSDSHAAAGSAVFASRDQSRPESFQLGMQLLAALIRYARPTQYYDIHAAQPFLTQAKTLAHQSFDAIAGDRGLGVLPRDRQPQTRIAQLIAPRQRRETWDRQFRCAVKNGREFFPLGQPCASRQAHPPTRHRPRGSGTEARTTFGAAGLEYPAAILGGHARTEPMHALAPEDTRLKRSLHDGRTRDGVMPKARARRGRARETRRLLGRAASCQPRMRVKNDRRDNN